MPGLVMNSSGADPRDGENRKRTHDGRLVNGDRNPKRDAASTNGTGPTSNTSGAVTSLKGSNPVHSPDERKEEPEEDFDFEEKVGPEHYRPLSKLYDRLAQECFNDMTDTLNAMANIPVHSQPNGVVNGIGGLQNRHVEDTEWSKQKKSLLFNFGHNNHARFVKLLVLTGWAADYANDIKKVINMNALMSETTASQDFAADELQWVKELATTLQEKNPDMRTALEILSKGKAEWIPDMGFIPPEPLSPEEGLKLMNFMNNIITVRLNVHERLPRHLKKWRVANGRVTFTFEQEFEMDLFTYSEDEKAPWLFADLRFLCSPAPEIDAGGHFLRALEAQANNILAQAGISGCFDFIHSFVLTHKINTLKTQAYQLSRQGWWGTLKVEPVHRSLVVQYWIERPGKKNWVEIGITTNKPKNGKISWRGPPMASLTARWFREGTEVKDVDLGFDYNNLSMETMLKRVIALHISSILESTRDAISPRLNIRSSLSKTEPSDCFLEVTLGRPDNKTSLSIEPVSGAYVLRPRKRISTQAEKAINQSTTTKPSTAVTQLLTQNLHDSIIQAAAQLNWKVLPRNTFKMDAVREQTKLEVLNYVILRPTGWSSQWVLTAVIDASGETWWCMKVGGEGTLIDHAQQISMEKIGPIPQISRATLASIDRIAAQQIEYHVSSTDFERRGVQCSMRAEFAAADSPDAHMNSDFPIAAPALRGWSLYVRTSDLLRVKAGESLWLDPYIRVIVQGFTSGSQKVSHIASGKMDESVASDLQKLMSASPQGDFVFFENGNFAIHLKSLFGEPIADELGARLRDLDRLRSFAAILQKRKMKLRKSSLQQVQFQYGNGETATVDFGQKDNIQVSFSPGNPHNRIARRLVELINNRPPFNTSGTKSGLERFCETLVYTRPILAALLELENAAPGNIQNPAVFAHNFSQYRITYANPLCSFDIRLRRKEDAFVWHIEDNDKKEKDLKPGVELDPNHKRSDALKTALSTLFKRTKQPGQRWMGTHTGILAPLDAIPDALKELHQTVISCAIEGGYKAPTENVKSEGASTEAKSEAGKPPAPSAGAQGRSQGNANANAKTRLNFPNAGRGPQGLKQEVIELDD